MERTPLGWNTRDRASLKSQPSLSGSAGLAKTPIPTIAVRAAKGISGERKAIAAVWEQFNQVLSGLFFQCC